VDLVGIRTVDGDVHARAAVARELVPGVEVVAGGEGLVDAVRRARPGALLAIGPLTNAARLAAAGALPDEVVVMGGVLTQVYHRGRHREAEHNFETDAAAAAALLAVHACTIVPLDVTVRARVGTADRARLSGAHPIVAAEIDSWLATQRASGIDERELAIVLHDPLALLVLTGDVRVDMQSRALAVGPTGQVVDRPAAVVRQRVVHDLDVDGALRRVCDLVA
jgi:inosine-uridine nucleoside N-ribohydrolase